MLQVHPMGLGKKILLQNFSMNSSQCILLNNPGIIKIPCLKDLDFENWSKTSKFGPIGCGQLNSINGDKHIEFCLIKNKSI